MVELGVVGLSSGRHAGEVPIAVGSLQDIPPEVYGLIAGDGPRVSVDHAHHASEHIDTRQKPEISEH